MIQGTWEIRQQEVSVEMILFITFFKSQEQW